MTTLFKYEKHTTEGPNGTTTHFKSPESSSSEEQVTRLCEVGGWLYVSVPSGVEMPDQPEEINWQQVDADSELVEILKRSKPFSIAKIQLRESIEREVGDLHDLVADAMRLNEFVLSLCLRVSHEVLTGDAMSEERRTALTQQTTDALLAIDSGNVLLRGDIEDPSNMLQRLMSRYSRITELVRDEYKPKTDALLP